MQVEIEAKHAHGRARYSVDSVLGCVHGRNLLASVFVDRFNKCLTSLGSAHALIGTAHEVVLPHVARDGRAGPGHVQLGVHLPVLIILVTLDLLHTERIVIVDY